MVRLGRNHYWLAACASLLSLSACSTAKKEIAEIPIPGDTLNQRWDQKQRSDWYRGSQGSRLIPARWLLALEAANNSDLFMDPKNFDRFGYIADPLPHDFGQQAWPIGFAPDEQDDSKLRITKKRWYVGQGPKEQWIGLNCAACHTSQIVIAGETKIIDGGATLADFEGFTNALTAAMRATLDDSAKWDRFAARTLKPGPKGKVADTLENRTLLRTAFAELLAYQEKLAKYNATGVEPGHPDPVEYGYGRLDAVGHILNKIAQLAEEGDGTKSYPQISGEPNAPVSYPFIWNANQHDRLQWNGIVENSKIRIGRGELDVGALVRNTTEVIGVFADVTLTSKGGLAGYPSSVDMRNLLAMEEQIGLLRSPRWPTSLAQPDAKKARWGQRLFKQHCSGCHADLDRTDLASPVKAEMTPIWAPAGVDTDPWMACNAFSYRMQAGILENTKSDVLSGDLLPPSGPTSLYLKTEAIGVLANKKWSLLQSAVKAAFGIKEGIVVDKTGAPPPPPPPLTAQLPREQRLALCIATAAKLPLAPLPADASPEDKAAWNKAEAARKLAQTLLAYKGRPLNGIWATGPYLHNGSVRSLYQLLKPVGERDKIFWVGNPVFDPKEVGFVNEQSARGSWFKVEKAPGQPIHGNSNAGHDYGNKTLIDEERWALVEYMKTL